MIRFLTPPNLKFNWPFWCLVCLVSLAFACGGSARPDVASLLVLRPIAAGMFVYGFLSLRLTHFIENRFVLLMTMLILALPIAQLVPLPPVVWTAFPGREIAKQVMASTGLSDHWQPLTLAPAATRNAAYALLLPAAVVLLGIRLDQRARQSLVLVVLAMGGLSALLGLAQLLASSDSPLFFYKITNTGGAVGLFANRNHQALLLVCLLPMLSWVALKADRVGGLVWLLASLMGLLLLPMILITGSRSGLVLVPVAAALIFVVLGRDWLPRVNSAWSAHRHARQMGLIIVGLGLAAATIGLGRAIAWERLFESSAAEDMRLRILPTLWAMLGQYRFAGTGMGSFERIYQVHEPDELLAGFYMNHAHNDWLELLVTGGAPAGILLVAALIAAARKTAAVLRPDGWRESGLALPRLGLAVILLIAIASLSDYPLRTPAISALFAVAVLWATCPKHELRPLHHATDSVSV